MKRLISILAVLFATIGVANASCRISLLTCGPGDAIYAIYGHSAMRVVDTETGADNVYNFGMFDFDTPGFVMKFLRGDLDYFVGVEPFDRFVAGQRYGNVAYIREQVLNLTDEQSLAIVGELARRYQPENRYYKYKFLQRNCTTELRDIIVANTSPDNIYLNSPDDRTYRYYLGRSMTGHYWIDNGVNLLLGAKVDRPITQFERMCLPDQLFRGLDDMTNGTVDLVAETTDIYSIDLPRNNPWKRNMPLLAALVIFALLISIIRAILKPEKVKIWDKTAGSVFLILFGLLGCVLLFLLFYGTHMEFKDNFNILWCNPLFLPLGIAVLLGRRKIVKVLGIASLVCLAVYTVIWITGVQEMESLFFAVSLIFTIIILRQNETLKYS